MADDGDDEDDSDSIHQCKLSFNVQGLLLGFLSFGTAWSLDKGVFSANDECNLSRIDLLSCGPQGICFYLEPRWLEVPYRHLLVQEFLEVLADVAKKFGSERDDLAFAQLRQLVATRSTGLPVPVQMAKLIVVSQRLGVSDLRDKAPLTSHQLHFDGLRLGYCTTIASKVVGIDCGLNVDWDGCAVASFNDRGEVAERDETLWMYGLCPMAFRIARFLDSRGLPIGEESLQQEHFLLWPWRGYASSGVCIMFWVGGSICGNLDLYADLTWTDQQLLCGSRICIQRQGEWISIGNKSPFYLHRKNNVEIVLDFFLELECACRHLGVASNWIRDMQHSYLENE
jgi:hypothetical protein